MPQLKNSMSIAKLKCAECLMMDKSLAIGRLEAIYQRVALRSPIQGSVEKVEVKTGQYVEPQTDLMEIVDTHHVHADLMVFEKDVYKVKEGQTVRFNVQSIPGKELTAEIYSVVPSSRRTACPSLPSSSGGA